MNLSTQANIVLQFIEKEKRLPQLKEVPIKTSSSFTKAKNDVVMYLYDMVHQGEVVPLQVSVQAAAVEGNATDKEEELKKKD